MRLISRWNPRSRGGFLTAGAGLLALALGFAPVSAQNTITGTVVALSLIHI